MTVQNNMRDVTGEDWQIACISYPHSVGQQKLSLKLNSLEILHPSHCPLLEIYKDNGNLAGWFHRWNIFATLFSSYAITLQCCQLQDLLRIVVDGLTCSTGASLAEGTEILQDQLKKRKVASLERTKDFSGLLLVVLQVKKQLPELVSLLFIRLIYFFFFQLSKNDSSEVLVLLNSTEDGQEKRECFLCVHLDV